MNLILQELMEIGKQRGQFPIQFLCERKPLEDQKQADLARAWREMKKIADGLGRDQKPTPGEESGDGRR